jgi:hypothetical protein
MLTTFAGWGVCGAFRTAGDTSYFSLMLIVWTLALSIGAILVLISRTRHKSFNILCRLLGIAFALYVFINAGNMLSEFLVGDKNLSPRFENGVACAPINGSMAIISLGFIVGACILLTMVIYFFFAMSSAPGKKTTNVNAVTTKVAKDAPAPDGNAREDVNDDEDGSV